MSESPANRVNGFTKSAADKMGKLEQAQRAKPHRSEELAEFHSNQ